MNYCLCLSFTDDSWEMLQDSNNQRLSIGFFQFHKKVASTYTEANNSWDVLVALHLMVMLQLEDFLVTDGKLSHICDSQMKFLKMLSNCQQTNHNSFGQVNKKFAWIVIAFFLSNWYSTTGTHSRLNLLHLLLPRIFQKKSSQH
jgi:hypothetical protein